MPPPSDYLNYPPELPKMATDLQRTATDISTGMGDLRKAAMDLATSSNSQSTEAFNQFQQEWAMTMGPLTGALSALGGQVNTGYENITKADADAGARLLGGLDIRR